MAEIVAVYDLDPEPRTVDDIIPTRRDHTAGQQAKPERTGPVVTGKWLPANVTDDIPTVIAAMFDEAERRDPHHERTWVALVDGNCQQIEAHPRPGHRPPRHRHHPDRLRPRPGVHLEGRLDVLLPRRPRR